MAPDQSTQMYADIAVIKSQTANIFNILNGILKILNGNGHRGLVERMGFVEKAIEDLQEKQESEEMDEKTVKNQKFELSGKIKVALITGVVTFSINMILMVVNLLFEIFKT